MAKWFAILGLLWVIRCLHSWEEVWHGIDAPRHCVEAVVLCSELDTCAGLDVQELPVEHVILELCGRLR